MDEKPLINPTEKFIRDRIENELTFNCFDTKRQYPIHTLVEWMNEHSNNIVRNVLLGLKFKMEDNPDENYYDMIVEELKHYTRK